MRLFLLLFVNVIWNITNYTYSQPVDRKVLSDCKVTFNVIVTDTTASEAFINYAGKTTKTVYVKDGKSRYDLITPDYKEIAIFRDDTDTVILLREQGGRKYITYLNAAKFGQKQDWFEGVSFLSGRGSKNILGYECRQTQAQLPNGSFFEVYFAPAIVPSSKDFDMQYKEVPGFVLQYESYLKNRDKKVRFTATSIDVSPVSSSLFAWPKTGYTELEKELPQLGF